MNMPQFLKMFPIVKGRFPFVSFVMPALLECVFFLAERFGTSYDRQKNQRIWVQKELKIMELANSRVIHAAGLDDISPKYICPHPPGASPSQNDLLRSPANEALVAGDQVQEEIPETWT